MDEIKQGVYKDGECAVIVTKDAGHWHLSISCADRLPSYDELKGARYKYLPNVCYMAQIFPPTDEFVNVHPFTLHLWEIDKQVSDLKKMGLYTPQ